MASPQGIMTFSGLNVGRTLRHCLARAGTVVCLALLVACQPTVILMPTPVALHTGEHDPFADNAALEQSNRVPVAYATNRLPLGNAADRIYSTIATQDLRLGIATLRIGDEGMAWSRLYEMSLSDDESARPVLHLENLTESASVPPGQDPAAPGTEARDFFATLNQALARSEDKDLMVYVHGANNNVYRATAQGAQYRHFTGRNSVVLVFAWPSAESLLRYATDVANARASVPVFARLLDLLARHTDAREIDILAYSAGAQVASPALALLGEASPGESRQELRQRLRLGEVYFAAPDVDFKSFVQDLSRYGHLPHSVTLSVNLDDTVLGFAQTHHGVSRAGRPNPDELDPEETAFVIGASRRLGFDVISVEPETIPGMSTGAHGFWYDNPWVSSDVLVQFLLRARPGERGLQENRTDKGFRYWTFPPDYPDRIRELLHHM